MPSPVSADHGVQDANLGDWLGWYRRFTPGLLKLINATLILDNQAELQPDIMMLIPEEMGGRTRVENHFLAGSPELVVEIGRSSRRIDLGPKKADYERAGVQEYLFLGLDPDEVWWFVLRDRRLELLQPGEDGVHRSEVFPGLWLDSSGLLSGDMDRLYAVLEVGLATPEHAGFVERLRQAVTRRNAP